MKNIAIFGIFPDIKSSRVLGINPKGKEGMRRRQITMFDEELF
jgi:hypothetical protein